MHGTALFLIFAAATSVAEHTDLNVTRLSKTPSVLSSDHDDYTCTGDACARISVVTCRRKHANWHCDIVHKTNIIVSKPRVSCMSKNDGVVCSIEIHTELPTPGEIILNIVLFVLLSLTLGPVFFLGALLSGGGNEYTVTTYDDC